MTFRIMRRMWHAIRHFVLTSYDVAGHGLLGLMRFGVVAFTLAALAAASAMVAQDWDRADAETIRLSPGAFPDLPAGVRADLERRQCAIPQPPGATQPVNATSGHFISATGLDWAVLCSHDRRSRILVFRDGLAQVVDELGPADDKAYLQTVAPGVAGFSRSLAPVDAAFILRHHDPTTGIVLPRLDHQGIDDAFNEKGSVVWYWDSRRWLRLRGSDLPSG